MRRESATIWGFWLVGLLMLTPVMTLFDLRPNDVQSDAAVPRPALRPSRVFDRDYYREIDDWITETAATRGAGQLALAKLDYELLGDSTNPRVAVGSGGWLFDRELVDNPCDAIEAVGRPPIPPGYETLVTYMVPLPKSDWLQERLASHDRAGVCQNELRRALREALAADPSALDVNALFDDDPEASFLRSDPQWSPAGRLAVAEAVVERLAPGIWEPDAVVSAVEAEPHSLRRLLGYAENPRIDGFVVHREVTFRVAERRRGLGLLTWQRSTVEGSDVVPGTTYLFGDEQLASVIPLVDQYFEELVFIGWQQTDVAEIDLDQLPPPDRVVVEAIERSAPAAFANPVLAAVFDLLPDVAAPEAPTDLAATVISPTELEITWSPAPDDRGLFNYLVARDGFGVAVVGPDETSYVDGGVEPRTTYTYTVTATDEAGNSATSDELEVRTPPPDRSPPSAPEVTAVATSPTTVEVTWSAAEDDYGVFSYLVARNGSGSLLEPDERRWVDDAVEPDTLYAYTVTATDRAGNTTTSEPALVATPPPDTIPPTLPRVTVEATSPTEVEISWTPSSDAGGVFNYLVARDGRGIAVVGPEATSYVDTDVEPAGLHAYTVTATDAAGNFVTTEAVLVATPDR